MGGSLLTWFFSLTHGTVWSLHIGGRTCVFWIKSLLGVRIRSIQDEVVSVIRVGDVTSCCRLFRKRIYKRCGEGLWWKSELKSPKTIHLWGVFRTFFSDWSISCQHSTAELVSWDNLVSTQTASRRETKRSSLGLLWRWCLKSTATPPCLAYLSE